jgi:LmeA-like phospholipid-binding
MTVSLVALIVLALSIGGLAGAELYARHRAENLLLAVAQCVTKDGAKVSFAVSPPFLWQRITRDYTKISVITDGNQVQDAKGMKADVTVEDVRAHATSDSKGTVGALDATLTWTAEGIKDTVAANLPGVGNLVTGLTTDAAAGTLVLDAGAISVTAKPVVVDGKLTLQVVDLAGPLDRDTVQGALDGLTGKLNDNFPLGIHADSVEVTNSGVVGKFSTRDASIPQGDGAAGACFAGL